MSKVLAGKEGWLFLQNDTNNVLDQITGKSALTDAQIEEWREGLAGRLDYADKNSFIYKYLIVPNSHCVYEQFLPDGIKVSPNRPAIQLSEKFPAIMEYPLDFLKAQTDHEMYYKTDTHWNRLGAAKVLNKMLTPICGISLQYEEIQKDYCGDLGRKLDPPVTRRSSEIIFEPKSRIVYDNMCDTNNGRIFITQNDQAYLPVGLAFGDSMFANMIPLLGEYFSRFYFFHASVFDESIISQIKPDVVLSENVERFVSRINMNAYGPEMYKRYFSNRSLDGKYVRGLPHIPEHTPGLARRLDTGIDYNVLDAYVECARKTDMPDDIKAARVEILSKNNLLAFLPSKKMLPRALGWRGNSRNNFHGWAFGYAHEGLINPAGFAMVLHTQNDVKDIKVRVFEVSANFKEFNPENLDKVAEFSFTRKSLGIEADSQVVYFPLENMNFEHGKCYLFTVESGGLLGCVASWDDLPVSDYFFRGYFRTVDKPAFRPVAGSQSISRTLVFNDADLEEYKAGWLAFTAKGASPATTETLQKNPASAQSPLRQHIKLKLWGNNISRQIKIPPAFQKKLGYESTVITTDSDGYMVNHLKSPKKNTLFLLGGSFVETSFVQEGKRFHDAVNTMLENADLDWQVKNASMSGSSLLTLYNLFINKIACLDNCAICLFSGGVSAKCNFVPNTFWNRMRTSNLTDNNIEKFALSEPGDGWHRFKQILELFAGASRTFGIPLILCTVPLRSSSKDAKLIEMYKDVEKIFENFAHENGLPLFNLYDAIADNSAYFYEDGHLNAAGAKIYGEIFSDDFIKWLKGGNKTY